MPNIIALRRKSDGTHVEGQALIALDEEICQHLGVETHPVHWYRGWVDGIGFTICTSEGWGKVREFWSRDPEDVRIVDYLESNFDNVSYACIGR